MCELFPENRDNSSLRWLPAQYSRAASSAEKKARKRMCLKRNGLHTIASDLRSRLRQDKGCHIHTLARTAVRRVEGGRQEDEKRVEGSAGPDCSAYLGSGFFNHSLSLSIAILRPTGAARVSRSDASERASIK